MGVSFRSSTYTPVKGRITVPDRGITHYLMFNPEVVNDNKAVNYGTLTIPGASHPVYQFGSGGERIITFDVYLDGDRGRSYLRPLTPTADLAANPSDIPLSVKNEIDFFQSLLYPQEYDVMGMTNVYAATVLFTFGELFESVPCVVKGAPYKVNFWTPALEPVRATINVTLGETVQRSRTAREVYIHNYSMWART